jgi:predicted kinase
MLIIFGGLPGTGKTTISRKLAETIGAVHLRIDTIETAIKHSNLNLKDADNAGYLAAYGLAKDNLLIGRTVIADSVNSIKLTREAWKDVAKLAGTEFIEIEVICSDIKEHQKRIETRTTDIKGHQLPTWQETINRKYENWEPQGIIIDTATSSLDQSIDKIRGFLSRC